MVFQHPWNSNTTAYFKKIMSQGYIRKIQTPVLSNVMIKKKLHIMIFKCTFSQPLLTKDLLCSKSRKVKQSLFPMENMYLCPVITNRYRLGCLKKLIVKAPQVYFKVQTIEGVKSIAKLIKVKTPPSSILITTTAVSVYIYLWSLCFKWLRF